jgi:methyltransferase (TIGR00027 family)
VTARWVAAHRLRLERTRPSTPGADVAAERNLYRAVRGGFGVPLGRPTAMAERTRFVDAEVAAAIGRGVDQMVLLGAGYDGRALRFGGGFTRWFEVDLAQTQADKRQRLAGLGTEPDGVTYIAANLMADDVGAALEAAGHRAVRPSLFVCEGLFAYLTLEATAILCQHLRARAPTDSVLVATFLVLPADPARGRAGRLVTDQLLRMAGEPRRSEFRPDDPEKLMAVTGWRIVRSSPAPWERPPPEKAHLQILAAEPA